MDLCDPVLEGNTLDLILDLAITQSAFEGDELEDTSRKGNLYTLRAAGEDSRVSERSEALKGLCSYFPLSTREQAKYAGSY